MFNAENSRVSSGLGSMEGSWDDADPKRTIFCWPFWLSSMVPNVMWDMTAEIYV